MPTTDNLKAKLEQIPNNVSGDGKNFVAQLKRFLQNFRNDTEERIDGIGAGAVEQVFGLHLSELHDYDSKGNPINNIFVEFDNTNVTNYLNAQIWMRKSTDSAYHMVGTTSNVTYTVTDVDSGATYYVKVIACNTNSGTSDFDTAPVEDITIQGSVLVPAAPTQFYLTWDEEGALWEWQFTDNGYVDFFELRMDNLPGTWNANRLDSTRETHSRVAPPTRSGTAYLYIRNIYGAYSQPATHVFNIAAPAKPYAPTLEMTLDGVVITMDSLPSGCIGYEIEITDSTSNTPEIFESKNNQFVYFQFVGSISVRYRFVDTAGHGEWSNTTTGNVKTVLNAIELPEISYNKFDSATQAAVDKGQTALTQIVALDTSLSGDIQGIINNLNQGPGNTGYSAISQLNTNVNSVSSQLLDIITQQGEGTATEITLLQSQITQNVNNINTIVSNLNASASGNIYASISSLKQQADSIASTVSTNKTTQDGINTQNASDISQLKQTATSLSSTIQSNKTTQDAVNNGFTTDISNLTQTANGLSSTVQQLSATDTALSNRITTNATNITQTNNSIAAVVTELSKTDPSQVNYAAITALSNGIDLCVKDTDLTGAEIVNRINIQPEITTIDGKFLHVTGDTVFNNSVIVGAAIAPGAITTNKLVNGAITASKLGDDSVTGDKISDGSVDTAHIVSGAVTSVKIGDGAVIAEKIAANAVTAGKIAANSVSTNNIQANAITAGKIAVDAVTAGKIAADAISSRELQTDSVIANKIAAEAVTTNKIAAEAVTAHEIASRTITADRIKAGEITANEIKSRSIIADNIATGAITADKIAAGAITADKLAAGTITADAIYQAGYRVKNVVTSTGRVVIRPTFGGAAAIPIPNGYTALQCIVTVYGILNVGNIHSAYFSVIQDSNGNPYAKCETLSTEGYPPSSITAQYKVVGIK